MTRNRKAYGPRDRWTDALIWVRAQMTKRAPGYQHHRSFLAAKVLEMAESLFDLPSYGVEGWSRGTDRTGVQYLNVGGPYDATIVVLSGPNYHRVSFTGWATYAGGK